MENIINRDIANFTNKSIATVSNWKQKQPKLLELTRLGAFCKKNNLDMEKIKKLIELQEIIKSS